MTLPFTLPPIVERELRVASRRRSTYWSRVSAAASGVIFVCLLLVNPMGGSTTTAGQITFRILAAIAAFTAIGGVLQTSSEAFAREKREDTLGLLFLTPLRPVDLVIGKLVSTSLAGFYQFLSIVPLLALPVLLGGVTVANFVLLVLSLINCVFLAAALGLFVSSRMWDEKRSASMATCIMFLLIVFPALLLGLTLLVARSRPVSLYALSPVYPLWQSAFPGAFNSGLFWGSLLWTQILGWILFWAACRSLPRCWQTRPATLAPKGDHLEPRLGSASPAPASGHPIKKPRREKPRRFDAQARTAMLERNPAFWLAMRTKPNASSAWVVAGFAMVGPVGAMAMGSWNLLFSPALALSSFFFINGGLKTFVASHVSSALARNLADDPLEILLSTPLTAERLINGHLLALRQTLKPLVSAALWIEIIWMALSIALDAFHRSRFPIVYVLGSVAVVGFLVPDLRAIAWIALWRGVIARNAREAEQQTFSLTIFLPWTPVFITWITATALSNPSSDPERAWVATTVCWVVCTLLANHWFARRSRRLLESRLKLWAMRRSAREFEQYDGWRAAGRWLGRHWRDLQLR